MTIARSQAALLGTDETTLAAVTSGSSGSTPGGQADLLADNTSTGVAALYLVYTPAAVPTVID